ncbi:MAG: phosphotransferase [Gammaproteobacteria bacterium]|nr:phosphotransferase [Gammaproteobacteria bacterium]
MEISALDIPALSSYFKSALPELGVLRLAEKFPNGQSNPTFLLHCDSGKYVLRRKPPGKLLKSAHAVDREFRVLSALTDTRVPTPRVLHLCEDETIIGSVFYVMAYIEGRSFWNPALPELNNSDRSVIFNQMARTLAAIHDVKIDAVGLSDFGRPGNYYERQITRWTSQYRASETETITAMEEVIGWLAGNMVADDGRHCLVHGDYRLDNILFATTEPLAIAVLDWELSTLGHPFADIAAQCAFLRMPPEAGIRGLAGINRRALGIPEEDEYVDAYCQYAGINNISNWQFYLVFSLFRAAGIAQGVRKRSMDGNASSSRAMEIGSLVEPFARLALGLI